MLSLFRKKSRVEKIQERLSKGTKPSTLAVKLSRNMSSKKHNFLIKNAVSKYNEEHEKKVFVEL